MIFYLQAHDIETFMNLKYFNLGTYAQFEHKTAQLYILVVGCLKRTNNYNFQSKSAT